MSATRDEDLSGLETQARPAAAINKEKHQRHLHDAQDALAKEFQALVSDTENLLRHTSDIAGVQMQELRERINGNLNRAKTILKDTEFGLEEQGRVAIAKTEEYVNQNPWQSIGIAAGVGFLLGMLVSRR